MLITLFILLFYFSEQLKGTFLRVLFGLYFLVNETLSCVVGFPLCLFSVDFLSCLLCFSFYLLSGVLYECELSWIRKVLNTVV